MENASKALLMAGGILIALMILGALIMMFTNLGMFQDQSEAKKKQDQIAKFNSEFEPYNKQKLSLMELKSVYSKIESNNSKIDAYLIRINNNPNIQDGIRDVLLDAVNHSTAHTPLDSNDFYNNFSAIDDEHKQKRVFICDGMDIDPNTGVICNMSFRCTN